MTSELAGFRHHLEIAQRMFAEKRATTEEMWCYDENWKQIPESDRKNTRFRIKADLTLHVNNQHWAVVDFKSGKRYYNEIKHAQQALTYGIGLLLRKPKVDRVTTELWYLDLPDEPTHSSPLTRRQAMVLLKPLQARLNRMLNTKTFVPKPNARSCRFCPYKDEICPHAVKQEPKPKFR